MANKEHVGQGASAGLINAAIVLVAIVELTVNFTLVDEHKRLVAHQITVYCAFALATAFYWMAKPPRRRPRNDRELRESEE